MSTHQSCKPLRAFQFLVTDSRIPIFSQPPHFHLNGIIFFRLASFFTPWTVQYVRQPFFVATWKSLALIPTDIFLRQYGNFKSILAHSIHWLFRIPPTLKPSDTKVVKSFIHKLLVTSNFYLCLSNIPQKIYSVIIMLFIMYIGHNFIGPMRYTESVHYNWKNTIHCGMRLGHILSSLVWTRYAHQPVMHKESSVAQPSDTLLSMA